MNKKIYCLLLIFVFVVLSPLHVSANEISEEILSSIENDLNDFSNTLPQYVKDFFPKDLSEGSYDKLLINDISEEDFLNLTIEYLLSGINTVIKNFSSILILIIISAVFATISKSFSHNDMQQQFALCSTLCISISVFSICCSIAQSVSKYMQLLCTVMQSFLPIMVTLLTMNGNISSAVISNSSMLLFINLIEGFLLVFMAPLIKLTLAFGCAKSLNGNCDFSGISKTLKNTYTSVTVFVMSIFMFVLSYKNILSQCADTISIKTARFAISSTVPLVGSSVNEALRTISSSLSLLKKSSGIAAIIIIIVLMLPAIINVFLHKLSFSFLSSISRILGVGNAEQILDEADSSCQFMLTIVACTCVLFIFALTIFIKTGAGS